VKPIEIARARRRDARQRVAAIRAAGRNEQRRLYEAVAGHRELRMTDMVAPGVAAMTQVRHHGRNTLPAFSNFEKRFCRPADADPASPAVLWGYNEGSMRWLTGPGYFVLRPDAERGELLVDYNQVPPTHPAAWPAIRPNERGLSQFVYGSRSTACAASRSVSVGSAARKGKDPLLVPALSRGLTLPR
jgi:hypothetical protein